MASAYINFCNSDDLLVLPYVGKRISTAIITMRNDVGNLVSGDLEFMANIRYWPVFKYLQMPVPRAREK